MRHFWGKVMIFVETQVVRSTDFALHSATICVTEKTLLISTSHIGVVI